MLGNLVLSLLAGTATGLETSIAIEKEKVLQSLSRGSALVSITRMRLRERALEGSQRAEATKLIAALKGKSSRKKKGKTVNGDAKKILKDNLDARVEDAEPEGGFDGMDNMCVDPAALRLLLSSRPIANDKSNVRIYRDRGVHFSVQLVTPDRRLEGPEEPQQAFDSSCLRYDYEAAEASADQAAVAAADVAGCSPFLGAFKAVKAMRQCLVGVLTNNKLFRDAAERMFDAQTPLGENGKPINQEQAPKDPMRGHVWKDRGAFADAFTRHAAQNLLKRLTFETMNAKPDALDGTAARPWDVARVAVDLGRVKERLYTGECTGGLFSCTSASKLGAVVLRYAKFFEDEPATLMTLAGCVVEGKPRQPQEEGEAPEVPRKDRAAKHAAKHAAPRGGESVAERNFKALACVQASYDFPGVTTNGVNDDEANYREPHRDGYICKDVPAACGRVAVLRLQRTSMLRSFDLYSHCVVVNTPSWAKCTSDPGSVKHNCRFYGGCVARSVARLCGEVPECCPTAEAKAQCAADKDSQQCLDHVCPYA